ncbi:hypothetical protein L596_020632 [Steinernema carpocapsae]|uniref:Uncharacterized protein n=1 Tax=Steinernema carpocapsae TaxID=34508 RepID=A0A4U5MUB0_STECR|nr:hypothetical protein L596_020632 [Steinernema carpocapsae]
MLRILLVLALFVKGAYCIISNEHPKIENARMDNKTFEAVHKLHHHWYMTSIKALMGQLGKELYQQLNPEDQKTFANCLDVIATRNDLTSGAKCLVAARKRLSENSRQAMPKVEDKPMGRKLVKMKKLHFRNRTLLGKVVRKPLRQKILRKLKTEIKQKILKTSIQRRLQINKIQKMVTLGPKSSSALAKPKNIIVKQKKVTLYPRQPILSPKSASKKLKKPGSKIWSSSKFHSEKHTQAHLPKTVRKPIKSLGLSKTPSTTTALTSFPLPKPLWIAINSTRFFKNTVIVRSRCTQLRRHPMVSKPLFRLRYSPNIGEIWPRDFLAQFKKSVLDIRRAPVRYNLPTNTSVTISRLMQIGAQSKPTVEKTENRRTPITKPLILFTRKVVSKKKLKEILKIKMRSRTKNVKRTKRSEYLLFKTYPEKPRIKQMHEIASLVDPTKPSVIQRVSNLIVRVTQGNESNYHQGDWLKTYEELQKLKKAMDEKKQMPGARAFDFRLYDLVLDKDKPTKSPQEKLKGSSLLDAAFDLIESVSGPEHKNHREDMNVRVMSPRIAPLMPDKSPAKLRSFSPSVLAFYKDDYDGNVASIPEMLENTGLDAKDRDSVIEMLMEVSGVRKNVNLALDILNHLNFKGLKGEILETTERLSTAFEFLEKSFSHFQTRDIDKRGFTFMEPNQMERILKDHGIDNPSDVGFDMDEYRNVTESQREESLWRRIELIAENRTEHKREKRAFTLIGVLAPVILAPYMFNPIFGLSILGPTILSPNIFSPLILNPSLLGPYILSPAVAMPFILSPYVLSPYILTPIVMAPFILNPYVLSPNVVNPYVLSPIILSPLVLCPDVLSPQVLGGAIFSPSVASPPILTESYLMGNVFSPSFLS